MKNTQVKLFFQLPTPYFGCVWMIVWLFGHPVFAQNNETKVKSDGRPWNLQECIEFAQSNSIPVKQSQIQAQISENNYIQSKYGRLPSVNFNHQQNLQSGRSIDPFSNQFVNQLVNSSNTSLVANFNAFSGFQQSNTIRRNELSVEVNQLNREQQKYNVALNVALNYLQVLQNYELLEVARRQIEVTKAQLERTQKLFDAGAVAIGNLANLQAQLANDELAIVQAENNLQISKVNLMQQMNYPINDMNENFDIVRVDLGDVEVVDYPQNPAEIYAIAEMSQPNIQSSDLGIKVSQYNVDIAKAGRYPTFTLTATLSSGFSSARALSQSSVALQQQVIGTVDGTGQTVSTLTPVVTRTTSSYPVLRQYDDNFAQVVGFRLGIPIFNGLQVKTNIRNSMLGVENAKLTAQNNRIVLRQAIEQAFINADLAANSYKAQQKQVEGLALAFEIAQKNFEAGAINSFDFSIAKTNLDRARANLISAKYNYLFRTEVLDFYQNLPLTIGD